jgi:Major Facilitator Superfamily
MAGAITGNLGNAHGIAGWRWLFIIEGIATVGVAVIAKFILLDFPSTSSHLSQEERQLATVRLLAGGNSADAMDKENRLTHWQAFKAAVCDYRTFLFMMLFVLDVGAGTISYFIPTITLSLGYKAVVAQYMTIPVYMVAAVCLNVVAFSADRLEERRWHITGALFVGCLAAVVCAAVGQPVVRYVMLCFIASGIWTALPLILAWSSSTINLPAEKRAICLAMINAVGNLSSVYGSQIWPKKTAPRYTLGFAVTASFLGAGAVLAALIPVILRTFPATLTGPERVLEERKEMIRGQAPREDSGDA